MRSAVCSLALVICFTHQSMADDWPQWLGPRRDGVWRESGILKKFPEGGPKVRWRVPLGAGYSGPAVADGRLFVLDRREKRDDKGRPVADKGRRLGDERVVCLDTRTGKKIWDHQYDCPYKISYPSGPRTTPLVDGERVYALGAMGHLFAFHAATGKPIWSKQFASEYQAKPPVWGWAAHPLLDGDRLICLVGGEGSAVVAFDKHTGKEIWRALTAKEIGYAPPVIHQVGGRRQLIVWLDTAVRGLDPVSGKTLWSLPFPADEKPARPVVTIATPRLSGQRLLISDFYSGSLVADLAKDQPAAKPLWRSDKRKDSQHKRSLNALMTTPVIQGGHIYGVAGNGEMRCLDLASGRLKWKNVTPTGERPAHFATCFIVPQADRFFLLNDQGYLIIARMTQAGYHEVDRAKLLEPTGFTRGRKYVWSHPAFAERAMFARNDKEMIRVDLSE